MSTSTGVVLAANNGCRVAVRRESLQLSDNLHRKVHHSAATLARWRVGAAAWSRAHHGKVYAGRPVQAQLDWKPRTFSCDDTIALAPDQTNASGEHLLAYDPLPEFRASAMSLGDTSLAAEKAAIETSSLDEDGFAPRYPGAPIGDIGDGGANGGAGGPALGLAGTSVPPPVPPTLLPTPEPSGMILLGTGMATLCLGSLRRRLGY